MLEWPVPPPTAEVRRIVRQALAEDMPWGDITSEALVPAHACASGRLVAREAGVIAGIEVARLVFEELDPRIEYVPCRRDGDRIESGQVVAEVRGSARALLAGERTALNLMQRMSGIATLTARYVAAVAGTGARIVDTRKTVPGLRLLDKYAVRCGGGTNHRASLSDAALVKDNHLATVAEGAGLAATLRTMRARLPHTTRLEVEVDRLDQLPAVLAAGADIVLLDNMSPADLARAVDRVAGRAATEASGGISLETVRAVAESGVDLISVGALTHSVRALDIAVDFEPRP